MSAITYDALDRLTFATTPGGDMGGRGKKHEYLANKANSVKKYVVADDGSLVQKGYYLEAALSWERITDEDNNVTDIYTNLLGQKVLERHVMAQGAVDTYFVYNDCYKLCYVLQPMYQQEADLDKFAFLYRYDNRGRMVEKTITGCEKITYTYDSRPYTHHAGRRDAQEGIVKALYLRRFGAHKFPNALSGKCHPRHRAKELLMPISLAMDYK